jgi:hypothetical protein
MQCGRLKTLFSTKSRPATTIPVLIHLILSIIKYVIIILKIHSDGPLSVGVPYANTGIITNKITTMNHITTSLRIRI